MWKEEDGGQCNSSPRINLRGDKSSERRGEQLSERTVWNAENYVLRPLLALKMFGSCQHACPRHAALFSILLLILLHAPADMFSTLRSTEKVVKDADKQFDHFHAVMAKPTT